MCAQCHQNVHVEWSGARHGRMLQPASPASVLGDFSRGRISLRNATYRLRAKDGSYYITESSLAAKEREYRVQYTLGSRRIQHYLTTLEDGRIIVLPPSWDVLRKQWFHNMDIVDPEENGGSKVQVWNKSCYSCHVSGERKNFDPERNTYDTNWQDFGTSCQRCHGPGEEHVARHQQSPALAKTGDDIVLPARLGFARGTMICAQCHSLRDMIAEDYRAGEDYFDYFLPILEYGQKMDRDPAYWPDGRPRRFSNDAIGVWQSECFLKGGVTCTSCHSNVHNPGVDSNASLRSNTPCDSCHSGIGKNVPAHSHHAVNSPGSSCVECHMPSTIFSIKAAMRDHSIGIPIPENTLRYGIPNACNTCHRDRDAQWTKARMNEWYGDGSRQKLIRRAQAFAQARAGNRDSITPLLAILGEPREGAIARANAAGHLSRFSDDSRVLPALQRALKDREAIVRAVAALRIEPRTRAGVRPLIEGLYDPVRAVRVGAVFSLVNLRARSLSGEDARRFETARQEYLARMAIQTDDGREQFNLGGFQLLSGDPAAAIRTLQTSIRLDPEIPARYLLACAWLRLGERDQATRILRTIQTADPYYAAAQRLLAAIP
jgi:tetratricopeptide (TPR) repeat protein